MTAETFVKNYADAGRGVAARAHHHWLARLDSGVLLPRLHPGGGGQLVFDYLYGRAAQVPDLADLAAALGQLHGAAFAHELHAAPLNRPFHTRIGLTIPDFHTSRRHLLNQYGIGPTGLPAAIYKDANIRNFVLTASGPAFVDFDDLTLAPFGYDLAKLVVSTAMTFGRPDTDHVEAALGVYNRHVKAAGGPIASCTVAQLAMYAEIHHRLTAAYLGRNGYRHRWPDARPWTDPCLADR